jgi:NAD(P)-dependent dehydrogenase (short-subunit alcohol dehydrogenase family)
MRILITGHTSGLGKYLFGKYIKEGHQVFGASRLTGLDLTHDTKAAIELGLICDLVVLNTNAGQSELLEALAGKTKVVVMGSIAGQYDQLIQSEYSSRKKQLAERCKSLSLDPTVQLLHMTISMLEDAVSTDKGITFVQVGKRIDDWTADPCYNNIDFEFKLSPFTIEQIKNKFGATDESIQRIIQHTCDDTKTKILPTT